MFPPSPPLFRFCPKTFFILRIIQCDIITDVKRLSCNAAGTPIRLKWNFYFPNRVSKKYWNTKFHENPSSRSRVVPCGRADGRTDRQSQQPLSRNSANAPSNFSKNFCYWSLMMALCGRNTLCVLKFEKPFLKRVVTDGLYLALFINVRKPCLK